MHTAVRVCDDFDTDDTKFEYDASEPSKQSQALAGYGSVRLMSSTEKLWREKRFPRIDEEHTLPENMLQLETSGRPHEVSPTAAFFTDDVDGFPPHVPDQGRMPFPSELNRTPTFSEFPSIGTTHIRSHLLAVESSGLLTPKRSCSEASTPISVTSLPPLPFAGGFVKVEWEATCVSR